MNAPHPLQPTMLTPQPAPAEDDEGINLVEYWDIIVDNRWLIAAILCVAVAAGTCYALLARPIYESNLLVQVEDNSPNGKSLLGDAAALLDTKTPTAAEIDIGRPRNRSAQTPPVSASGTPEKTTAASLSERNSAKSRP